MQKYIASFFFCIALTFFAASPTQGMEKETIVPCRDENTTCWPTGFSITPKKGNIFYIERYTGQIRRYKKKTQEDTLFATIENIAKDGEQGLLGIAIDPRWPDKKWVYVYYTNESPLENRIIRLKKKKNGSIAKESLLTLPASSNHNGGSLAFGPDKKLYAAIGDVSNPANAQDLTSTAGKILRINKNGTIPEDNPKNGSVYWFSYGHRNMFGMTFDPFNLNPNNIALWVTENGPECNDEINIVKKNKNYGWGENADCPKTNNSGKGAVTPTYLFKDVLSLTGAAFCDDCKLGEAVEGNLLIGTWNTGSIMNATLNNARTKITSMETLYSNTAGILSINAGNKKKILFSDQYGIYRLKK